SKILRSQFDGAPFAAVFFLVLIFLLLGALMPVPGLHMQLNPPAADNLPGVDGRTIAMAVDSSNRCFIENRLVNERQLKTSLQTAVASAGTNAPLTLIIHADRAVSYEQLTHLALVAREKSIGITNVLLATLPRVTDAPAPK